MFKLNAYGRRFFFDADGNPLQIVEENGDIREYAYDANGNRTQTRRLRNTAGAATSPQFE